MSKMDWTAFTLRIPVRASKAALYKAWTTAAELEHWFLRKARHTGPDGRALKPNARITKGGTYVWEWFGYDGMEEGRILEANGKDHLRFTFAGECHVDVRLRTAGKQVIVELVHSKIPTDEASKRNIWIGCLRGWNFWLTNLKSVYEGGLNLRNEDTSLKGMLNN